MRRPQQEQSWTLIRTLPLLLIAVALLVSGWAVSAHVRTDRPSNDPLAIELGPPDPQESVLEGHLAWAIAIANGEPVTEAAIEEHLAATFLDLISPAQFTAATIGITAQGPWKFFGFDQDPDVGFAVAMLQDGQGEVHALSVTSDVRDPSRLSGLLVAPVARGADGTGPFTGTQLAVHVGAAVVLSAVAALAIQARREQLALLLAAGCVLWAMQLLELSDRSFLFTAGLVSGPIAVGAVSLAAMHTVSLHGAVGSRRRGQRLARLVVGIAAISAIAPLVAMDTAAISLPDNLLSQGHDRDLLSLLTTMSAWVVLGAVTTVIVYVVVVQLGDTSAARRHAPAVLGTLFAAMLVGVPAAAVLDSRRTFDLSQTPVASVAAIVAAVGIAVSISIVATTDLGAVTSLLADGSGDRPPNDEPLEPLLAQALGDPQVQLARWDDGQHSYVTSHGRVVSDLTAGDRVTLLSSGGAPLGAVLHARSVRELDQEQLGAATAAARVVLENEKLHQELQAQLGEVQSSRARILEAGESARRQVERDLHDGAQQRLLGVLLAVQAGRRQFQDAPPELDSYLSEVADDLSTAIAELREISRGLHPASLEQGLGVALESLAETGEIATRVDVVGLDRCSQVAERAAYFVVSEAIANATRHSDASIIEVTVSSDGGHLRVGVSDDGVGGAHMNAGSGLQNIGDRVQALGGSWSLDSQPGVGTTIEAVLPCG